MYTHRETLTCTSLSQANTFEGWGWFEAIDTHTYAHINTPLLPSFDLYYTQPRDLRRVYKLIMDRQPSTTPKPSWWYTVQHCTTPCCSFMGFVWIDTHTHTHAHRHSSSWSANNSNTVLVLVHHTQKRILCIWVSIYACMYQTRKAINTTQKDQSPMTCTLVHARVRIQRH